MVEQAYGNKQNQLQRKTVPGPNKTGTAEPAGPQFESRVTQSELDPIQASRSCCGEVNRLADSMESAQLQEDEDLMQGSFHHPVQREQSGGSGVTGSVMSRMENAFQADFSDVKVHPNSAKAPEVGAVAYTQGTDIHFAPGQFKPDTSQGRQLLGHELTHVVQQREGKVQPTTEVGGLPVNDNPSFEKEADDMGKKVNNF